MIEWGVIGLAVGTLLGFTGAGGAIVALPLFVYFAHMSLRDATVVSLIAVVFGAGMNWFFQRKHAHNHIALTLVFFSSLGSFAAIPLKAQAPDWIISTLFIVTALTSLFNLWSRNKKNDSNTSDFPEELSLHPLKAVVFGLILGFMITMTGLGGGVILIPLLVGPLHLPLRTAVPTSMLTVFLSAAIALGLQIHQIPHVEFHLILIMAAGSLISAVVVREALKKVSQGKLDLLRQVTVSAVIIFAIVTVGSKILV